MILKFTIPLPPRTKKNSQRIISRNGKAMIIPSKLYKEYEKMAGAYMPAIDKPIDEAVNVKAFYFMPSRRRVDLTNLHEALHDLLVYHGILADDNSKIIVSTDGSRVFHDKENPRTEVEIESLEVGDE